METNTDKEQMSMVSGLGRPELYLTWHPPSPTTGRSTPGLHIRIVTTTTTATMATLDRV